jgi:hypothetical protein
LHSGKVHNVYFLSVIIRVSKSGRMKWMGQAAHGGEMKNADIVVRKPEGKRQVARPKSRGEEY